MSFMCQDKKAIGQSEGALGNESLQKGQDMEGGSVPSLLEPGVSPPCFLRCSHPSLLVNRQMARRAAGTAT